MRISLENSVSYALLSALIVFSGYCVVHIPENIETIIGTILGILTVSLSIWYPKHAIGALIFLAPLSIPLYAGNAFRISFPSEVLTLLLVIILGVRFIIKDRMDTRYFAHPLTLLLIVELIWYFITTATSSMHDVSFKRFALKLGFFLIYYLATMHWLKKNRKWFFLLYAIGLLYPIYHYLSKHAKYEFSVSASFEIPQPYFSDHTIFGACLAFLCPFVVLVAARNKKNVVYWLLAAVILTAMVLSYSRASLISVVCALVFYGVMRAGARIWHVVAFILFAGIVISLNFDALYKQLRENEVAQSQENIASHLSSVTNLQNDASNLERINRWVSAYSMFRDRPLVGFGPGTYQFQYDAYQNTTYMTRISTHHGDRGNAHSEYLTALSETGLPGFLIFLTIVFYSLHLGLRNFRYTNSHYLLIAGVLGLLTFYIHGTFNTFLDYEKMSILYYGSLGLLVLIDIENKEHVPTQNLTKE